MTEDSRAHRQMRPRRLGWGSFRVRESSAVFQLHRHPLVLTLGADGLGFVQHPIVSPEISAIAVFHSLHCLVSIQDRFFFVLTMLMRSIQHAIHGGYYKAVSMHLNKRQQGNHHDASDGVSASHEDHQDPAHLRHCFDYLRQSLMCRSWTELYMDERT